MKIEIYRDVDEKTVNEPIIKDELVNPPIKTEGKKGNAGLLIVIVVITIIIISVILYFYGKARKED